MSGHNEMKLFTGSANPQLAKKIAKYLKMPLGEIDITRFPDGEIFVKLKENIRDRAKRGHRSGYVDVTNPAGWTVEECMIWRHRKKRPDQKVE